MADIKLETFKANLKDTVRPNRFWVTVLGNQAGASWTEQPFSFMVKSFVLPARTIGEIVLNYQGMQAKIAGDPTFDDVSMSVHIDYEMSVKKYFEQWMEGFVEIGDDGSNIRLEPSEYKAEIRVDQLGREGEVIASYMLVGAWPKNMNTVELNHDSQDTASELNIDFALDYWKIA